MLPSSHKWLRGKKAIKPKECARDISTAVSVLYVKMKNKARGGGIRICHRPWTKNQNYVLVQTNVRKISVATVQAEKHIFKDGIYPEQRFKSHYPKCFMQLSNTAQRKPTQGLEMPQAKHQMQSRQGCIVSPSAWARLSQAFPFHEGSYRTPTRTDSHA